MTDGAPQAHSKTPTGSKQSSRRPSVSSQQSNLDSHQENHPFDDYMQALIHHLNENEKSFPFSHSFDPYPIIGPFRQTLIEILDNYIAIRYHNDNNFNPKTEQGHEEVFQEMFDLFGIFYKTLSQNPQVNQIGHQNLLNSKGDLFQDIDNNLQNLYGSDPKLNAFRKCFIPHLKVYIANRYGNIDSVEVRRKILQEIDDMHFLLGKESRNGIQRSRTT